MFTALEYKSVVNCEGKGGIGWGFFFQGTATLSRKKKIRCNVVNSLPATQQQYLAVRL